LIDFGGETIDRIAVGRRCCFALAESGTLHVIDFDFTASAQVKLSFGDDVKEYPSKDHRIVHFAVGWHFAAAVVEGVGLVFWKSDLEQAPDLTMNERLCRVRRIIRSEEVGEMASSTEFEIIGLMVGDGYLVYLTDAGTVYRVTLSHEIFEAASTPSSFLLKHFITTPKLSYLSGSFLHFGLFNTTGTVLIGNVDSTAHEHPISMPSLQNRGMVGLSWGDWHGLALCEDGSILSWGKELQSNGCLGLGYHDHADARQMGLAIALNDEVVCAEPRRVPGFGGREDKFAFCVAAAGWHSAALVADFKVRETRKRQW
jgi:SCF-associated factor 1